MVAALMNGAWKSAVWCRTSWNDERIRWFVRTTAFLTPSALILQFVRGSPSGRPCMSQMRHPCAAPA